ncbi:MAG: hypothetical protein M3539_06370 [Acidobacteriota bacterium]|nr:hypothetical protein [Acidobacteriota bacterium]
MRQELLAPFLILLTACTALAQNSQCSLKLSDLPAAPELFGFRLGMTTDEVKARVPKVKFGRADEFEVLKTSINPHHDSTIDQASYAGVRTISLDFLDRRLTSLWLGYDESFKWQTADEFVAGISQSLRLPNAWTPWRTRGHRLRCADFEMTVMTLGVGPSFRILDDAAQQTLAARREAREAQESSDEENATTEVIADRQEKTFYPAGCQPVDIKPANRVVFSSKEEAEQAGYKPAKSCTHDLE